MNSSRVWTFAFGKSASALVERGLVRVRLAARHLHEREEVLRLRVLLVPGRGRDGHVAERRAAGRRVEDPLTANAARRRLTNVTGPASRAQVVLLGEVVVDERAVRAERREHALEPSSQSSENTSPRLGDSGREVGLAEDLRLARPDAADRRHARRCGGGLRRGDRDGRVVVLGRDRVVGREDVVDRARGRSTRSPAASTATSVTSARPIISAAAVEAVRCGLRRALSRARRPATPPSSRRPASRARRERAE